MKWQKYPCFICWPAVFMLTHCALKKIIDSPEQILYVPGGRHLIVFFLSVTCVYIVSILAMYLYKDIIRGIFQTVHQYNKLTDFFQ